MIQFSCRLIKQLGDFVTELFVTGEIAKCVYSLHDVCNKLAQIFARHAVERECVMHFKKEVNTNKKQHRLSFL